MAGDIQSEMQEEFSDRNIGINVMILRGTRTQKEIADGMKELGFKWTQTTVWEVESGKRSLKAKEARGLARVLNTHVQNLFGETAVTQTRGVIMRRLHKIKALEIAAAEAIESYALARTKSLALAEETMRELIESGVDNDDVLMYLARSLKKMSMKSLEDVLEERTSAIQEAKKTFGDGTTLRFFPGANEIVPEDMDDDGEFASMLFEDEADGIY